MASEGKAKRKDTKSYQKLLDEIKTNPLFKLQAKAGKLGLTNVWAYHCNRCNYVWLPKDFDMARDRVEVEKRCLGNDMSLPVTHCCYYQVVDPKT